MLFQSLGIDRLGQYAHALGYGERTGIELTGEETGMIPTRTWKRVNMGESWATGDTYLASMGQGYITASPLQVMMSFATVAAYGVMPRPTLIREVLDERGNTVLPFTPRMLWDITKEYPPCVYWCPFSSQYKSSQSVKKRKFFAQFFIFL